ncbi:2,3-diaminopropionate biosynthesis protein SbnB [Marinomonas sp. UCMA 3892]|uniref:2,3-diaminopropionate biosynthesis protein SbnB n=1 Tax=unclassified Marinomonas TaxID=196814 RepID=UPI000C1E0AF6|nr:MULTISPECIES: 2,3-diaminopropionate biosynthesis protein SbnB [unclassified Marinomonas]NLU99025.1 2,3-diaminopropionate biosynthesis protein SbnB [Marinomonas sp. UCMA 3892]PJE53601.1 ornithine cyclodeaminase [Marinomonas sp. BSi20584]
MTQAATLRYLSQSDLRELGANHSNAFIEAIEEGLKLHADGNFVQPLKPYLRWQSADHIADRIIAMPCYLGGDNPIAGIKWIGSRQHNPTKFNLPRASALIILNDAQTNYPVAVMEASLISSMRTAAITGVATKYLAKKNFADISIIGCGPIGQMQVKTLLEQFSQIKTIHLFDVNMSAADKLISQFATDFPATKFSIHESAQSAIEQADVLVTCTVSEKPYIPFEWLKKGCFVSNISIMDIERDVFLKADKVVVDDWDQSNREKKVINLLVEDGLFSREQLHAELGEIILGNIRGRETDDEIILLNPMGMAIDDIVCARWFYQAAESKNAGTELALF